MSDSMTIYYSGTTIYSGTLDDTVTLKTKNKMMDGPVVISLLSVGPQLPDQVLENNSWDTISYYAQEGTGGDYWSVGDTKSVDVSGTMGAVNFNTTFWVFIIGINHRDVNGITFQGFKTAQSDGKNVCFINNYNSTNNDGNLAYFTLNHWGNASASPYNTNYGGWAACDMRYDLLGSTNVAPSPYGSIKTTSATGSNPTNSCATSPKANTLMSCLPSDLREVMQPMTIYTDNKGNSSNVAVNVTTTIDYLPLLSEYELFGARTWANEYEQDNQAQYEYYRAGNQKVMYRHSAIGSSAIWFERSPRYNSPHFFCAVNTAGNANAYSSRYSVGISPIFLV